MCDIECSIPVKDAYIIIYSTCVGYTCRIVRKMRVEACVIVYDKSVGCLRRIGV